MNASKSSSLVRKGGGSGSYATYSPSFDFKTARMCLTGSITQFACILNFSIIHTLSCFILQYISTLINLYSYINSVQIVFNPWHNVMYYSLSFILPPVNCGDPTPPSNGSIVPYQNTTEGAVISFACDPMFVPSIKMTATFASNGMWTPDPHGHTCICEYLI